uniref:Uncharacterized protein n=1 Tax=Panagrolaimus superbus TaxID=310955 RepID=A0A914XVE1_9BILA
MNYFLRNAGWRVLTIAGVAGDELRHGFNSVQDCEDKFKNLNLNKNHGYIKAATTGIDNKCAGQSYDSINDASKNFN